MSIESDAAKWKSNVSRIRELDPDGTVLNGSSGNIKKFFDEVAAVFKKGTFDAENTKKQLKILRGRNTRLSGKPIAVELSSFINITERYATKTENDFRSFAKMLRQSLVSIPNHNASVASSSVPLRETPRPNASSPLDELDELLADLESLDEELNPPSRPGVSSHTNQQRSNNRIQNHERVPVRTNRQESNSRSQHIERTSSRPSVNTSLGNIQQRVYQQNQTMRSTASILSSSIRENSWLEDNWLEAILVCIWTVASNVWMFHFAYNNNDVSTFSYIIFCWFAIAPFAGFVFLMINSRQTIKIIYVEALVCLGLGIIISIADYFVISEGILDYCCDLIEIGFGYFAVPSFFFMKLINICFMNE